MHTTRYLVGTLLAIGLCTGSGESSNPELARAELPADVLRDCAASSAAPCGDNSFDTAWVARLPRGHLFLVKRAGCEPGGCAAWLVAKDEQGNTQVMLAVVGEVRLERSSGNFPIVRSRAELSENYIRYARYDWSDGQYARTETRLVHRIGGFECASEDDCDAAAKRAMRNKQTGRALRIWQQVHGVNWI